MWILTATALIAALSDMTPQEVSQTGLSKLSSQEKTTLQSWIDKNYTQKSGVQGTSSKKQPGPSVQENLRGGQYIRLSDGSLWEINPSDTPISQGWITAVEIKIDSTSGDPNYPNKLTNSLTGSWVRAKKVQSMAPTGAIHK